MTVDLLPLVSAWNGLQTKLRDLDDEGYRVPCLDMPDLFVSDELEERQAASSWCSDCPAATDCTTYAETAQEPFGVWGGHDRSPRTYRRKENNR